MADNSYAQLIDDYENGILVEPGETLTQYIDRMGGVDYKADGGAIGIEVLFQPKREEYQTGGISEGNSTSLASLQRQGYTPATQTPNTYNPKTSYDARASMQDYASALKNVSGGRTYQQLDDLKAYARNLAADQLKTARFDKSPRGLGELYDKYFKGKATLGGQAFNFGRTSNTMDQAYSYNLKDKNQILDDMAQQIMVDQQSYEVQKLNQQRIADKKAAQQASREQQYADYMNNLVSSTYGKADDYKAEARTLGMPTAAYFDYLVTSDPKDVMTSYDTLSRSPYFDPKTYVATDYSNPETPRPPSPYEVYFQQELQNQIRSGIPQGQRIQQGQVLGLPTVLTGPPQSGTINPGYESYADVLARNKKMMGLRDGGRVGLFMGGDPLTGQALAIYNSMNSYGFTDQQIADALSAQGLYGSGSTPASDTPVTNTAKNIINKGGDGENNLNTLQSFRQDPSVMPAFEALQRNQQLTSMGINDPFANEASLSGAYYDDMPEDTSNQVGVYQPGIIENIKNKIGSTKIGSMFTGATDKLTNNKLTNTLGNAASTLGNAASFMINPIFGGAKMLASGLNSILPPNQRAINENIAANLGIGVDNIGRIQGDYGTVGGVMSGYNLSQMDADTFDKRTDSITQTLTDKYGFTKEEIEDIIDGTYKGNKGYNKTMGKQTNLIRDLRNINKAKEIILGSQQLGLKELERIEKEKAAAKSRAESARQYDSSVHGPVNYGLGSDGKQSYDTGLGFGANATTGGPVSNRTGRGRTDYSRGGLATMFKNKR